MHSKDALGRHGEAIAARCLADQGLAILETNWRCARGEIDIVAADGDCLVICEVKTRTSEAFGDPAEAVNHAKSARLRSLGLQWLTDHPSFWQAVRFDVVTVLCRPGRQPAVRHLRNAF